MCRPDIFFALRKSRLYSRFGLPGLSKGQAISLHNFMKKIIRAATALVRETGTVEKFFNQSSNWTEPGGGFFSSPDDGFSCSWSFRANRDGEPAKRTMKYCKGTITTNHRASVAAMKMVVARPAMLSKSYDNCAIRVW